MSKPIAKATSAIKLEPVVLESEARARLIERWQADPFLRKRFADDQAAFLAEITIQTRMALELRRPAVMG